MRLPIVGALLRAQHLLNRQTTGLRSRDLMRRFAESGLDGLAFTLGTTFNVARLSEPELARFARWTQHAPEQSQTTRDALQRYPTVFGRISRDTTDAFVYRGWWLCGATMSTYHQTS